MSDGLLRIGVGSLVAFENSLQNVGHNLTNAQTPGYTRQRVDLRTNTPAHGMTNYGNGVYAAGITRLSDEYTVRQLRVATSTTQQYEAFREYALNVDSLLADENIGISPRLQDFFSSVHAAASNPNSMPERQVLFAKAENLVSSFQEMDQSLRTMAGNINNQIHDTVVQINSLTDGIAQLNQAITSAKPPSADLLDQRDELIRQVSQLIDVTVLPQTDGSYSILVGSGQLIVSESKALSMSAVQSKVDPEDIDIQINVNSGLIITDKISNGTLGGLLKFNQNILVPAREQLGLTATAFVTALNLQHESGMDLEGNIDQLLFNDVNTASAMESRVVPNIQNTGDGFVTAAVSNMAALDTNHYQLKITNGGNNYEVHRLSDDATITKGSISTLPQSINAAGMQINLESGVFRNGDSFLIQPSKNYILSMGVAIAGPQNLALASPIRTSSVSNNAGTGMISSGAVSDITNASFTTTPDALAPPIRIEFLSATSYRLVNDSTGAVIDAGPLNFSPNFDNQIFPTAAHFDPGYRVSITGAPAAGDAFTISFNTNGFGDNRNALALSDIQTSNILVNGTTSIQEYYGQMVSAIGAKTNEIDIRYQASQSLLLEINARHEELSGVNLDEEAANLLRFQQAYQASAQLINTANELFNSLMMAIGG